MLKTYQGSCHCGAVRFEADIDLAQGTNKCNCTICTKTRNWNVIIKPAAFRLISGEDAVSDYRFGSKQGRTCSARLAACAVSSVATSRRSAATTCRSSSRASTMSICDEFIEAPVRYANGRDNKWWEPPAETRHL